MQRGKPRKKDKLHFIIIKKFCTSKDTIIYKIVSEKDPICRMEKESQSGINNKNEQRFG
jgi:hypothetical protein